jgi:hypothetical protein
MGQAATALALQKWASLFYPDKGQEKYGEVVIHPLSHGLVEAARRTSHGLTIESHSFGLNTSNEEEHGVFLTGVLELWSAGLLE